MADEINKNDKKGISFKKKVFFTLSGFVLFVVLWCCWAVYDGRKQDEYWSKVCREKMDSAMTCKMPDGYARIWSEQCEERMKNNMTCMVPIYEEGLTGAGYDPHEHCRKYSWYVTQGSPRCKEGETPKHYYKWNEEKQMFIDNK